MYIWKKEIPILLTGSLDSVIMKIKIFNGYLDLTLENSLHVGEQFSLYWKTDGNKQRTKTALELPYLSKLQLE
jgi:hypothetical protein